MLHTEPSKGQLRREEEWERGLGPVDERRAAGPVRVIPVTLAMQEQDRRRQQLAAHNPVASAWRAQVLGSRAKGSVQ